PGQSGAAERSYQRTGQGGHDHDPLYRVGHQDAGHADPGGHQGFLQRFHLFQH
ncbi:Rubredoxin, partial [Dysosmobacter welbionis]